MTRAKKEFDPAEADLEELAAKVNSYHNAILIAGQSMFEMAWAAGQLLLIAKERCEHGQWLPWLEANFHGSRYTAHRYMTLATNVASVQHFDPELSIRAALEAIRDEKQEVKAKGDEPQGKPKANGGKRSPRTPTMPCQKFEKRYYGLSDDLAYIVQTAEQDVEFAAAAYNQLDHLVEQRNQLTLLIKKLRTQFKSN